MKLIIEIDEKLNERIKFLEPHGETMLDNLLRAIQNGTPLPKRLISIDTIIETLCPKDEDYDYPCICPSYLEHELEQMVLDADRSEEE